MSSRSFSHLAEGAISWSGWSRIDLLSRLLAVNVNINDFTRLDKNFSDGSILRGQASSLGGIDLIENPSLQEPLDPKYSNLQSRQDWLRSVKGSLFHLLGSSISNSPRVQLCLFTDDRNSASRQTSWKAHHITAPIIFDLCSYSEKRCIEILIEPFGLTISYSLGYLIVGPRDFSSLGDHSEWLCDDKCASRVLPKAGDNSTLNRSRNPFNTKYELITMATEEEQGFLYGHCNNDDPPSKDQSKIPRVLSEESAHSAPLAISSVVNCIADANQYHGPASDTLGSTHKGLLQAEWPCRDVPPLSLDTNFQSPPRDSELSDAASLIRREPPRAQPKAPFRFLSGRASFFD